MFSVDIQFTVILEGRLISIVWGKIYYGAILGTPCEFALPIGAEIREALSNAYYAKANRISKCERAIGRCENQ